MKRKINWYAIIHEIFNIAICCRCYSLELCYFNSGEAKQFWFKMNALRNFKKYTNENSEYITVTLYDNLYKSQSNNSFRIPGTVPLTIKNWQSKKWNEIKKEKYNH